MNYYQTIFNLSDEPEAINFDKTINFSEFEVKQLNSDRNKYIQEPVIMTVNSEDGLKELDVNLSNFGAIIVSEKFKRLFEQFNLEFFMVETPGYQLLQKYYILKIPNFIDCVNEEETKLEFWTEQNSSFNKKLIGNYKSISNLTIDSHKVQDLNIFRLKKFFPIIIVSEYFVNCFISNHCSGLRFIPIKSL